MSHKITGLFGVLAVILSTSTIIIMAELRSDDYDHLHKAVSELGSWDAPHKWTFNILGYVIPGLLIALFSLGLLKEFKNDNIRSYPFYCLMFSGLFMVLAGVFPADMANRQSTVTLVHMLGSLGGGIFWLITALTLWWQLKKNANWKNTAGFSFSIPFLMIVVMSFIPESAPGLTQRIAFGANYLFILIISIQLIYSSGIKERKISL